MKKAFNSCQKLKTIESLNPNAFAIAENTFYIDVYDEAILIVPEIGIKSYQNTSSWNKFYNIVASTNGIETIKCNEDVNVSASQQIITITGLEEKTPIFIYSTSGELHYENVVAEGEINVEINQVGVYLVKVGKKHLR